MENWNKNEWQGRRKDQYESSALFVSIALGIIGLVVIGFLITTFVM